MNLSRAQDDPRDRAMLLKDLTARQVQKALAEMSESLSTRSLRLVHQILERAIRHAQASDLVGRNVASLVTAPAGRPGRPSRAMTFDQAAALLDAAAGHPLSAYLTLSLLSGLRTEDCAPCCGRTSTSRPARSRCTAASAQVARPKARRADEC